jgi:hypothetical protein
MDNSITMAEFHAQLARVVGTMGKISIRLWPYRYEGFQFLALDFNGDNIDGLGVTITVGERFVLEPVFLPSVDLEAESFAQALAFALEIVEALGQSVPVLTRRIDVVSDADEWLNTSTMFQAWPTAQVLLQNDCNDWLSVVYKEIHKELMQHVGRICDIHCELCEGQAGLSIQLIVSGEADAAWIRLHDEAFITASWSNERCWYLPEIADGVDMFYAVSVFTRMLLKSDDYCFPSFNSRSR